jgi:hypothetical protein
LKDESFMMQPMPESEAPAQPQPGAGGGPAEFISGLQSDMKKLGMLLEKSGAASPEQLEAYSGLIDGFEQFIESVMGGAEAPQDDKPAPAATGGMEAGANPNARPM